MACRALHGHASTHRRQSSGQVLSVIGFPVGNGASISTADRRTRGPYRLVITTSFFPIHPMPALVAAYLKENGANSTVSSRWATGGT